MRRSTKFLAIVALTCLVSCDDILEEDISNDNVVTVTPQEDDVITNNVTQFRWETLGGADDYRIQIVTDQQVSILDSLVNTTTFTYPLDPGDYAWRVRAENFAYETPYTFPTNFSVQANEDLTNQQVALSLPSDALFTNLSSITFAWLAISTAETYQFQLVKVTGGEVVVDDASGLTSTSYLAPTTALSEDAQYRWQVKAVNATSETAFSSRTISIDRTNPETPTLDVPVDNATFTVNEQISFEWTFGADTGTIQSPVTAVLELATDTSFTNIVRTYETTSSSQLHAFDTADTYYWRVRTEDSAGNVSSYTETGIVIVN